MIEIFYKYILPQITFEKNNLYLKKVVIFIKIVLNISFVHYSIYGLLVEGV